LQAHFQRQTMRLLEHQTHIHSVWDREYDQHQAQACQDLTDDIMDLQNREMNPMFFTPGGSSSQGGH
ncbi:hypothetical protein A2U01_0085485, partial [Trifolium medium]|nr:hypothetical protein [Trifolium medium]